VLAAAFSEAVEGAAADEPNAAVLDAAFELFCRHGIQRTSMDEVARRAGLSRITVYRRFSSKDRLVEQVVRREFRRYFDQFLLEVGRAPTLADRIAVGFVSSLRAIRGNPLIGGWITAEPEPLVVSLVGDGGGTFASVRQFVASQLRREQAAGNVGEGVDVDLVAELMVRVSASFLVIPSTVVDLDDDTQLDRIAREFLVPMVLPRSARPDGSGGLRVRRRSGASPGAAPGR